MGSSHLHTGWLRPSVTCAPSFLPPPAEDQQAAGLLLKSRGRLTGGEQGNWASSTSVLLSSSSESPRVSRLLPRHKVLPIPTAS